MTTTKIFLKPYLSEWAKAKWWDERWQAVRLPSDGYLYLYLYDAMSKRDVAGGTDASGNLSLCLPERGGGKNPRSYRYVTQEGRQRLESAFSQMFWAEVYDEFDCRHYLLGVKYKDIAIELVRRWKLTGISEEGLLKSYRRWRGKQRSQMGKRYVRR